jgi:hypothetical protein
MISRLHFTHYHSQQQKMSFIFSKRKFIAKLKTVVCFNSTKSQQSLLSEGNFPTEMNIKRKQIFAEVIVYRPRMSRV